jgi:hypothetical protein
VTGFHRAESDIGWIKRRIGELDRKIERLGAARRLESASIGAGGLHVRGGDIFLDDTNGVTLWKASEDPIKTRGAWASDSGLSIPTTWTQIGLASAPVPAEFVGIGHFLVNVSAGDTMSSGTGSISVQPLFRWRFTDDSTTSWFAGEAIASPDNRIAVASSFWAANFAMTDISGYAGKTVASIEFGVNVIRSFGTETGTDGNWHVAASVIFKRGGGFS